MTEIIDYVFSFLQSFAALTPAAIMLIAPCKIQQLKRVDVGSISTRI